MVAVPDPSTFQLIPWRPRRRWRRHVLRHRRPRRHARSTATRATCSSASSTGRRTWASRSTWGPSSSTSTSRTSKGTEFLDHGRLLRPDAAGRGHGLPQAHRAVPRGAGHPRRVRPPRGRAVPARDRPALHRRAVHGRQRHDLPPDGEGGRAGVRRVRHLHAEAGGRASTAAACTPTSRCSRATATRSSTPPTSTTCPRPRSPTSPGILRHAREITLVTNQWVNSYKRLVPGYEAPVYICWARRNRSALVRVPMYKPGKEKATRIEFRSPDPACNPYLAFAAMLAAGPGRHRARVRAARPRPPTTSTR